jgi:hypothetical protein
MRAYIDNHELAMSAVRVGWLSEVSWSLDGWVDVRVRRYCPYQKTGGERESAL